MNISSFAQPESRDILQKKINKIKIKSRRVSHAEMSSVFRCLHTFASSQSFEIKSTNERLFLKRKYTLKYILYCGVQLILSRNK